MISFIFFPTLVKTHLTMLESSIDSAKIYNTCQTCLGSLEDSTEQLGKGEVVDVIRLK